MTAALIATLVAALVAGCASARARQSGDPLPPKAAWALPHFDGQRFYNPRRIAPQSALRIARHILFGRTGRWPERTLEPQRALALARPLGRSDVAVTFVNHATVLLQIAGLNILTDPVWSHRVGPWSWAGPPRARQPGIPFDMLPRIDVVLISHNHYDHLDLPTLRRLGRRDGPRFFVPLGDRQLLLDAGLRRVQQLDWWQRVPLDADVELIFAPAQHNSGRSPWTANRSLWGSHLVRRRGALAVYFAGDTAYAEHFSEVRRRYGAVDLALLPIGAYAPREMMKAFHMNPAEAVRAQLDLDARVALAIHYGTFQLSAEDFDQPVRDLRQALKALPVSRRRAFLALPEGRTKLLRFHAAARASASARAAGCASPRRPCTARR
ncbi:MAG: MBL fold metallo-hydrolase [Myxococcales bacterium]|nr:MBL fold metallo-hydrolase [Myxococcales bacterium]